ncbi:MAG: hypothetical protein H6708_18485 [Kofleriaceae bacterium]|nr:hypothetical protein [Kofleriaceae bacterium]
MTRRGTSTLPGALLVALAAAVALPVRAAPPRGGQVVRVEHRPSDQNPALGPSAAPVTAELFFVPGQIESNRAYRRLLELQSRHPRRLRVVFRVITRQAQVVIPIAALEAYAQGKFDDFMQAILSARAGTVRRDNLPDVASAAGMDPVRLDQAIERALDPDLLPEPLRANERRRLRRRAVNVPDLLLNGAPIGRPLQGLDVDELERYYDDAYAAAQTLLDDGVPLEHVVEAAEQAALPTEAPRTYPAGPVDDAGPGFELPEGPPPLLSRPLELTGLPADGPEDAPTEVVILCNLRYASCRTQVIAIGRKLRDLFPDEIRLVFYPWFDADVEGNEDAARLHRAAVCAEQQGVGWRWVEETVHQVMRQAGDGSVDAIIGKVAELAEVDPDRLDACLSTGADADLQARVGAAIAAGVDHGPAVVIGGRVYLGGFTDWRAAAPLVEAELAPGLLGRAVPDWAVR